MNYYRSDHGIGTGAAFCTPCEIKTTAHVDQVIGILHGSKFLSLNHGR
jgi:hypothetical protein